MTQQFKAGLLALVTASSLWAASAIAADTDDTTPADNQCPQMMGQGYHHGMMAKKFDGKGPHMQGHFRGDRRGMRGNDMMGFMPMRGLDLTDAQQATIKKLKQQSVAKMRDERIANHKAMQTLMQAKDFDEAKATQLLQQRQQQRSAHQLARLKLQHDMMQVLTAEQKQKLQQRFERKRGPKVPQQQ